MGPLRSRWTVVISTTLFSPSRLVLPLPTYGQDVKTQLLSDWMTDQWAPIYSMSTSRPLFLCAIGSLIANWFVRSSVLVDSKGTLCAQLNARLVRPTVPALISDTSSTASPPRSLETPFSELSYPSSVKTKAKKKPKPKEEKVYTSLRRGGR